MLTYLYSDDDFPYQVPDERSVAHLNALRAAAQNIHPVFHALLLRIHVSNNDRLFPEREVGQVTGLSDEN